MLWPWLVGMMPVAGVLFALDGVFFGAGDLAFLRRVTLIAALGGVRADADRSRTCSTSGWAACGPGSPPSSRVRMLLGAAALALPPLARGGHADGRRATDPEAGS